MLWCCRDFTKLDEGDKKGLAEVPRPFLEPDAPAGMMMNFRPLGDVACDGDAAFPVCGVFDLFCPLAALKLSSLNPYLGKVWLSYKAFVCESITGWSTCLVLLLCHIKLTPSPPLSSETDATTILINYRLRAPLSIATSPKRKWITLRCATFN